MQNKICIEKVNIWTNQAKEKFHWEIFTHIYTHRKTFSLLFCWIKWMGDNWSNRIKLWRRCWQAQKYTSKMVCVCVCVCPFCETKFNCHWGDRQSLIRHKKMLIWICHAYAIAMGFRLTFENRHNVTISAEWATLSHTERKKIVCEPHSALLEIQNAYLY